MARTSTSGLPPHHLPREDKSLEPFASRSKNSKAAIRAAAARRVLRSQVSVTVLSVVATVTFAWTICKRASAGSPFRKSYTALRVTR